MNERERLIGMLKEAYECNQKDVKELTEFPENEYDLGFGEGYASAIEFVFRIIGEEL